MESGGSMVQGSLVWSGLVGYKGTVTPGAGQFWVFHVAQVASKKFRNGTTQVE